MRRALFKLERGVCQAQGCGLDCHDLVRRLQAVERGSAEYVAPGGRPEAGPGRGHEVEGESEVEWWGMPMRGPGRMAWTVTT